MSDKLIRLWAWFKKIKSRLSYTRDLFGGRLAIARADLSAVVIHADGTRKNYGIIARKKVVDAFVQDICNCLAVTAPYNASTTAFQAYKYHACGTGTTAESNTQTALVTDSGVARATGTQVSGGSSTARTYTSVATMSFVSSLAITEHAVFNASTSGTMLDRSVFSAINVISGDSIQFTYVLTINAEA